MPASPEPTQSPAEPRRSEPLAATPQVEAARDRLAPGSVLTSGSSLVSFDGRTVAFMQTDGNFVVYAPGGRAVWASNTRGATGAVLAMQTDGNLVIYGPSGPVWATGTRGASVRAFVIQSDGNAVLYGDASALWATMTRSYQIGIGEQLLSGQSIVLPDQAWQMTLQADGNVVVYGPTGARWQSGTRGVSSPRLLLQGDGNLVLYGGDGRAYWATHAYGAATVGFDLAGNVLSRSADGGVMWMTGTGLSTVAAGWSLGGGEELSAPNGAYRLVMQTDGNLVVYSATAAVWSTRTYSNPGARVAMAPSGELFVYTVTGRRLWQSSPGAPGGLQTVIQNDGNLVSYGTTGATWSSYQGRAVLLDYPDQITPPVASVSRYVRNLRSDAEDTTLMRGQGCADAARNPAGNEYLVLLAIGAQSSTVSGQWGVLLTTTSIGITNASVVNSIAYYVEGYAACQAADSRVTIAVGTNNDSSQAAARGATAGTIFAQQVINPLAAFAAKYPGIVIAGANDIEPGFRGSQAEALDWTRAYLAATAAPYVFFGSADGCPYQTVGSVDASCNHGYSQLGLYQLAFGLAPDRMIAMPQIYYSSSMPIQWTNISLTGVENGGSPVAFGGPLTEAAACAQAGTCFSLSATDAWWAMWNLLNSQPKTAIPSIPFATDLRIDYRGQPSY